MSGRILIAIVFSAFAASANAQGYAGLGAEAEGYAEVTRPADLKFPRDHGPHPEYRIEWWYLTAALTGDDGRDYGVQWTLFRVSATPEPPGEGWDSNQIWIGHAGTTTPERHFSAERFARGGVGQAGAEAEPFQAWIDDWTMTATGPGIDALRVTASGEAFGYALDVTADGPILLQGEAGFSLKSQAGQASYYYSQPHYRAEGALTVDGREIAVTGTAWLDREWSSQQMSPDQSGWDWFSLHLDDGARLMVYRLRETEGPSEAFGAWVGPDGATRTLTAGEIAMTPLRAETVAGREVPVDWRVEVPSVGVAVETRAVNAQSWMDGALPYWEGPIRVTGSHSGRGYLEMTGYE